MYCIDTNEGDAIIARMEQQTSQSPEPDRSERYFGSIAIRSCI